MRAAVSILFLLLLTASASAQEKDEVILLSDGAYSTTVKGGLRPGETRTYYVSAKKGQQFTANLISLEDNAHLVITDGRGAPLLENLPESARVRNLDIILPRSGKFKLEIAAKGQCSYLLEVTLDDPPAPAPLREP